MIAGLAWACCEAARVEREESPDTTLRWGCRSKDRPLHEQSMGSAPGNARGLVA
jgi:hypothetical protein